MNSSSDLWQKKSVYNQNWNVKSLHRDNLYLFIFYFSYYVKFQGDFLFSTIYFWLNMVNGDALQIASEKETYNQNDSRNRQFIVQVCFVQGKVLHRMHSIYYWDDWSSAWKTKISKIFHAIVNFIFFCFFRATLRGKAAGSLENTVVYPPNGVIPFHGFAMFCAPFCYVYDDPEQLYLGL